MGIAGSLALYYISFLFYFKYILSINTYIQVVGIGWNRIGVGIAG